MTNTKKEYTKKLGAANATGYTTETVERALDIHGFNWQRDEKNGYIVTCGTGVVELKNVREAAIFVYGAAERKFMWEAERLVTGRIG